MKKRLLSIAILITYSAILIKIMVFKDVPIIHIGQLMLNFGGTDGGHPANFVPFATIVPYLLGHKGWIIAGINLVGNIALLVPIGILLPLIYRNISWKKTLVFAFVSGLAIETLQTVLRVGIFDIDDVILNALGVMIGYFAFIIVAKWVNARKYTNILIAGIIVMTATVGALYAIYPLPAHSELSAFTWRYQAGALNLDGIPGTKIFLDAVYDNGNVLSREIDEVDGSCNEILPSEEDADIIDGSTKIQCYAAGLGQWFKITKGESSYLVLRKTFEEALPDYASPSYQYESIAEFPTVY